MYQTEGVALPSIWPWLCHPPCAPLQWFLLSLQGHYLSFCLHSELHVSHSLGLVEGNAKKRQMLPKETHMSGHCSGWWEEFTAAWGWEEKRHPSTLCHCLITDNSSNVTKTSYFTDLSYVHVWAPGQESSPDNQGAREQAFREVLPDPQQLEGG